MPTGPFNRSERRPDHIALVALDFLGQVRARVVEDIAFAMPDQVAAFVGRNLDAIRASGRVDMDRIAGIGVAIPDDFGQVDLPQKPTDFGIWETVDPKHLFSEHGLEVFVENDATAAAIGELQFGHGRTAQTFFYVLISAGMGGGLVIDGHPVTGSSGRSGEIGFLPIGKRRRNPVNLQDVVSLSGLREHLAATGYPDIDVVHDLSGPALEAAREWVDTAAELLCDPLLVISAVLNPDAIFIGGRLPTGLVDLLCDQLALKIRRLGASLPVRAPVRRAALAEDAAAMGAAILPFSSRFLPSRAALMKVDV